MANLGAHAMPRSFGPLIRPGGRLIVVAGSLGRLGNLDGRVRPLFEDASFDQVETLVENWRAAVHAGTAEDQGWPQ